MNNGFRILLFSLCFAVVTRAEESIKQIPYFEFLTAAKEGKITEVNFNNLMGIEGEMKTNDQVVRFQTTRPMQSGDDPLLLRFLQDREIKITKSDQSKLASPSAHLSGFFLTVIMFIISATVACLSIAQFRILRRIERKADQALISVSGKVTPPPLA